MSVSQMPKIIRQLLRRQVSNQYPDTVLADMEEIYRELVPRKGRLSAFFWVLKQWLALIPISIQNTFYWGRIMLSHYLKSIFRNSAKNKGYTFINLLGLMIGLSCCLYIFLYVQDELSYDRFHKNTDRIYRVTMKIDRSAAGYSPHFARCQVGWLDTLPDEIPEIEQVVRFTHYQNVIQYNENKFYEDRFFATDRHVFDMFDFHLIKGDPHTVLSDPSSLVISESMAFKYFGDDEPIGKTVSTLTKWNPEKTYYTVTGVMKDVPANSHFHPEFIISLESEQEPGNAWYYTYILLNKDTSPKIVEEKLSELILKNDGEREAQTTTLPLQKLTSIHLESHIDRELEVNGNLDYVRIFSLVAVLTLLIACFNFMNLSTARWTKRSREVGLRKVFGAERRQLIVYFLGESVVACIIALFCAMILVRLFMPIFESLTGKTLIISFLDILRFGGLFTGLAVITGLIAGSYPALFLSSFHPIVTLKGGLGFKSQGYGKKKSSFRRLSVVFQFIISIALIISTIVIQMQTRYLNNRPLGFKRDQLIAIPDMPDAVKAQYSVLKQKLLTVPGILGVTAVMDEPAKEVLDGGPFRIEGVQPDDENLPIIFTLPVDGNIIDVMEMEIVAGERFSTSLPNVLKGRYILNEAAVRFMGFEHPDDVVGKFFGVSLGVPDSLQPVPGEIVGVVKDFNYASLRKNVSPMVLFQEPFFLWCALIRVETQNLPSILDGVRSQWESLFPDYPLNLKFVDDLFAQLYKAEQQQSRLISIFTFMAIFVACLGLLGLAAYTVEQRTKEVGVRKVLGAGRSHIVLLLSRDYVGWVTMANVIAWPAAYYFLEKWLNGFAYRISLHWWIFLISGISALAMALSTVGYQTMKAARANPAETLKYE